MADLTLDRLRELLEYNPATGEFRWRPKLGRKNPYAARKVAGSINTDGYRVIRIDYQLHYAHRLAWLYIHGEWPPRLIDHRNNHRSDNRFHNLRLANDTENTYNRPATRKNKSGFKGVAQATSGRWRATINGKHLGVFDTPELASDAYEIAARELHGEFASIKRKVVA